MPRVARICSLPARARPVPRGWEVIVLERLAAGPDGEAAAGPSRPPGPVPPGPDPRLLAAFAPACGVGSLVWRPLAPSSGRGLWLLGPGAAAPRGEAWPWVLKLRPGRHEAGVLRALASCAAAVGAPLPVAEAPAAARALCMTRRPGRTLARRLSVGAAIPLGALAGAMAALHAAPVPRGLPLAPEPEAWLAARLRTGAAAGPGTPVGDALARLRDLSRRGAGTAPVLSHGAWFPRHVLVDRGAVTGVVDWGMAALADPARDLASAVVGLFAEGLSGEAVLTLGADLVGLYGAAGGRPLHNYPLHLLAAVIAHAVGVAESSAARPAAAAPAWGRLLALCLEQDRVRGAVPAAGGRTS